MKYSLWNMVTRGGDGGGGGGGSSRDSNLQDLYSSAKDSAGLLSDMASATANRDFYSDRGGGGRDSSDAAAANAARIAAEKATYEQQQAQAAAAQQAAQQAAEQAAQQEAANAARIAAERAAYQTPAPQAPSLGLGDIAANLFGITPAEAGTMSSQGWENYNKKGITPQPPINYDAVSTNFAPGTSSALFTGAEPSTTNPFEGMFVSGTGGVYPGPAPQLQTNISNRSPMNPNEAYGGTSEEFETQPVSLQQQADTAEKQAQAASDAAAMRTGFSTGADFSVPTTTDPFDLQMAGLRAKIDALRQMPVEVQKENPQAAMTQATTYERPFPTTTQVAPTASPYASALASIVNSATAEDAAAQAKKQKDAAETAAIIASANAPQPLIGTPANVPLPMARPADLGITPEVTPAAPAPVSTTAAAPKTAAATPAVTPAAKSIVDLIQDANAARIAELEKDKKFAGGSKEQVAAALGVDPSQLQSRIVNYDGQQKVDYYTKGLDQALGEMLSGIASAPGALISGIGGMFGGNQPGKNETINAYAGRYPASTKSAIQGDYLQGVPSSDWVSAAQQGPTGPVPSTSSGGKGGDTVVSTPVSQPVTQPVTPVTPTPAPPLAKTSWSRTRTGLPFNPYRYGYGGEYTYYSAEGGAVPPLSKLRK